MTQSEVARLREENSRLRKRIKLEGVNEDRPRIKAEDTASTARKPVKLEKGQVIDLSFESD